MRFIGDCHGKYGELSKLIDDGYCMQVGDMGVGFPHRYSPSVFPPNLRFIRGNKDNPDVCRDHPNYLGDYGFIEDASLFYLSGAWSINWRYLTQDITWWAEEELSIDALEKALTLYNQKRPRIVISHECPDCAFNHLLDRDLLPTRTSTVLGMMWEAWQPEYWFFGHFHTDKEVQVEKTKFVCLGELSVYQVPNIKCSLPFTGTYTPPEVAPIEDENPIYEISADQMQFCF